MRRVHILWVSVLLASCSSAPKIALAPESLPAQGAKKFVVDDTRYYKSRDATHFYKIDDGSFAPLPKETLNSRLVEVLGDRDAEKIKLKKLSVYFVYSRSELDARLAMGLGAGLGGAAGMAMMASAQTRNDPVVDGDTDRQTLMCDFLARYRGRIIELNISEPACNDRVRICVRPSIGTGRFDPLMERDVHEKVASITQACISQAIARIDAIKDLPPLADADQEIR